MNKKGLLHSSLILRHFLWSFSILVGSTTVTYAKTILTDTIPLRDRTGDYLRDSVVNPFNLSDPSVIKKSVELDPLSNRYFITEKIGDDFYFRPPSIMTYDEYLNWKAKEQERDYFERLAGLSKRKGGDKIDPMSKIDFSATQNSKLKMLLKSVGVNGKLPEVPKLDIKKMGDNLIGMIFGDPPTVDIRPQGQIDLTLGGDYRYYGNPILPTYARTTGGLLFNMDIQMNVTGKIGEKLNLNTAFNNKAAFDFDNLMKIKYNSNVFSEDDIIKSIEGGNVSLPLRGTLIQGSQNLFGLKTELQFGYLRLTALAAQQKNRRQNLAVQGGSQVQNFNVPIDQYDENRHFFLTHFNRNTFEKALKELPLVNSLFSIDKIEVWVSNERNEDKEVRQIVALADLGEPTNFNNPQKVRRSSNATFSALDNEYLPNNNANDLYERLQRDQLQTRTINTAIRYIENSYGLVQGQDFVKRSAKRLQPSEYQFNAKLGTLSINNVDRQQILGVSFSYFYNGKGPFQVGEFGQDVAAFTGGDPNNPNPGKDSVAQVLFVKLLKNTIQSPTIPLYDLMMKNVYSVGAYVTSPQDLRLDILYQDVSADKADKRSLPELSKVPLLTVLNLDRLNQVGDPQPDGQFDFIPDVTINTRNGRIMFPKLEPFGSSLTARLTELGMDPSVISKYIYQELYDSTLFRAQERQEKNRFLIRGQVKSTASNRIQLNAFGLRPGAVTVTAGSFSLLEGVDYAIDYGTSTLTILNPAYVAPNIPLNISYEDNALFGFQTRTMLGLRADYQLKKNFNIGATFMNLFEIPYTRKVNFGDDPINNKVYGADINFTEDAPWLTKLVDKLPFIETKEPSKITVSAEAALLKPGHSKAIEGPTGDCQEKGGIVYLDDFEGSSSPFSLMSQPNAWQIASVPQKNRLFPEASSDSLLLTGVNRAMLNWYRIDQYVLDKGAPTDKTDPCTAPIGQTEVFPNRDPALTGGVSNFLPTFDLSYYPSERGPYNFDAPAGSPKTPFSAGLRGDGNLNAPESRWAGIMRGLTTTDFEQANVEYVDFWLLDPFLKPGTADNTGSMYIHLGDISEDILKDGRKFYENGLPSPENKDFKIDKTAWGFVPRTEIPLPNSFSSSNEARIAQDVGVDGMNDDQEKDFYKNWLTKFSPIPDKIQKDPSNDNFTYYNDESAYPSGTPVLTRYKKFNGLQGNAASNSGFQIQSATNLPDAEDVNRDNSFEENEAYFSYKIPISRDAFSPLTNKYYIENTPDPLGSGRIWHHFRIPIDAFDSKHGAIADFRSIRFMRLVVKDFAQPVCLRFAKLDLIRNQWRRYKRPLSIDGFDVTNRADNSAMELVSVNLEENSKKCPFNYIIPPCIQREVIPNAFAANARQNEQSLGVRMLNLLPNVPRAAFKLFSSDMRIYERLKMFVHAEQQDGGTILNDKMSIFMRIGSDFERNYYEYEIPLKMSDITKVNACTGISNTSEEYKEQVWLKDNKFDFPLSLLTKVKVERNTKNADLSKIYAIVSSENPNHRVKVIGNPDIGSVKGVMVGVYNKDRVPHDLELWLNELRMTGLNENAGGAAIARVDLKMADFGNLSVSGNYMGIGYGAIDQRVTQRSREVATEYAVNGNFELGKFFSPKVGLHVPFNVQYSNNTRTPEYDPYDLDIKLKDKLLSQTDGEQRAATKAAAQTVQVIQGYSFNNVRKDRGATERKPAPWDIENFAVSYANTNVDRHDPLVESDAKLNKKGSLDYTYSREPLYITPFKKLVKNPSVEKYMKLITEMNFNPIPNNVGFNTILDRQLNITKYRFSGDDDAFNTFYMRRFSWDRNYNLQWDLTRALKLNFDAKNFAIVDELADYNNLGAPVDDAEKKKFLNDNLKNFGRTKRYDHNFNVNYTVPTRNIPFLEWVQLRGTYTSSYGWEAAALGFEGIGNNINNKQSRQVNADMNFTQLYSKFKYLRKIQEPLFKPQAEKTKKRKPGLNMEDVASKIPNAAADSTKGKKKKKKGETEYEPTGIEKIVIRPMLLLRNARLNYTEQFNSFVPGFTPQARLFGMSDLSRPGWDYVLGYRQADDNWLDDAGARSWISRDIRQLRPTLNNYSQQIDARLTVEPFTDFRVDIDLTKNYIKNQSQEYRDTTGNLGPLVHSNQFDEGSYNISYFTLNTLFSNIEDVFNTFSKNREEMSRILGSNNPIHPDFPSYRQGFGPTNQDVVVPAFIAAYTGKDIKTSNKNIFNERPSVNWRLSYNGLAKLPGLKNTFNNISITHGYKSSLTVNSYRTSQFYDLTNLQKPRIGSPYEYYSQYDIPVIAISEQFSPLLGIDMSFKSGANFGLQYRKSRNLALSLSDTRLQETKTSEFQIKFGHRIKNVYIKALDFNLDGKEKKKPKKKDEDLTAPSGDPTADPKAKKKKEPKPKRGNDLVLNFDLSFRDDITENHLLGQGTDVPSRGSQTLRVSPSATYTLNKRLDLRFYVDYNRIIPYTTAAFPSTTATGGFVVTFKLN